MVALPPPLDALDRRTQIARQPAFDVARLPAGDPFGERLERGFGRAPRQRLQDAGALGDPLDDLLARPRVRRDGRLGRRRHRRPHRGLDQRRVVLRELGRHIAQLLAPDDEAERREHRARVLSRSVSVDAFALADAVQELADVKRLRGLTVTELNRHRRR